MDSANTQFDIISISKCDFFRTILQLFSKAVDACFTDISLT